MVFFETPIIVPTSAAMKVTWTVVVFVSLSVSAALWMNVGFRHFARFVLFWTNDAEIAQNQPEFQGRARRVFVRNSTHLNGFAILSRAFARRIIVSERARLMYCPIPKAACSNWKYLIRKFEGFDDFYDLSKAHDPLLSGLRYLSDYSAAEVERLLADPRYFKYAFVRDPYSRILSCYMDKFRNKDEKYRESEYRAFLAALYGWRTIRFLDTDREPPPSFTAFVDEVSKQSPGSMNDHWMPQTLLCGFGEMPYDFVGRLESLETDAKYVFHRIGRPDEHFPSQLEIGFPPSGANHKHVSDALYTLETMFKVRVIYDIDFNSELGQNQLVLPNQAPF